MTLSPNTRSRPVPASIVSPAAPPMRTSSPARPRMMSLPPIALSLTSDASRPGARPARTSHVMTPWSPRTRSLPAPTSMVSPSAPPRTTSRPLPVVIVSAPPTVAETVSRRPDDSGSCPQRRVSAAIAVKRPLSPSDDVAPVPADDRVAAGPADDDVVAAAGGDGVVAAGAPVGGPDAVEVGRVAVEQDGVDEAVVADDDVGAGPGCPRSRRVRRDGVAAGAAEHDVRTEAGRDGVARRRSSGRR